MLEVNRSLGELVQRIGLVVFDHLDAAARNAGLPVPQLRLLQALGEDRSTMSQLGSALGLDKSSASGLVDRAVKAGLVQRERDESDARVVLVAATAFGRERLAVLAAAFEHDAEELLGALRLSEVMTWVELTQRMLGATSEA